MAKQIKCCVCEACLGKNEIGLNKKLINKKAVKFFCLDCLTAHLDVSVEDLLAKIEDFKNEGCTLFD